MTVKIKGYNTGVLLHQNKFLAVAFKVREENDSESIFYMQANVLKDFLMLLQNRIILISKNVFFDASQFNASVSNENQSLLTEVPVMSQEDIQTPNTDKRIVALSANFLDNDVKILFTLKNGNFYHFNIHDTQIHFIILALGQAIKNSGINDVTSYLTTGLDFIPLYDVIFKPDGNLNYSQFEIDAWKLDIFSNYVLLVYRSNQDEKYSFGGVVKTNANLDSEELNSIAMAFASSSPKLKEHYPLIENYHAEYLILNKKTMPSTKEALQPLAEFHKRLKNQ
ncbi:TPA: hypothetical protein M2P09_004287 [Klebsiella quasipneumoniae]|nr:hypothetical protein [Klebsiella quasipneumoniae]